METYQLTQEEFQSLKSEDISVKHHKELMHKTDLRFTYIIQTLEKVVGRSWEWYDYDNCSGTNSNPIHGFFDIRRYPDFIEVTGKMRKLKNPDFDQYDQEIPTSWLYTAFERDLEAEVMGYEHFQQLEQEAKNNEKAQYKAEIAVIESSLKSAQVTVFQKAPESMRNNFVFRSAEEIYQLKREVPNPKLEEIRKILEDQKVQLRELLTPDEFMALKFKTPEQILAAQEKKVAKKKM